MLGKKLYRTSMTNIFRLIIFAVSVFFFNDFYLETFTYEKFQLERRFAWMDVIEYHYRYPQEFLTFFFLIIVPAVYYGLIRGVVFYEKGFIQNSGIPFLNKFVAYNDIANYKVLHPKAISISSKKGEVFVIGDNSVERVIGILDQHGIPGNLAQDDYVRLIANYKKFALVIITFTAFIFLIKKLGLFQTSM